MSRKNLVAPALALSAALLLVSACGSSDDGEAGDGAEATHLSVGVTGLTTDAPLYIAQKMGWFKEAGLDVEINTAGGAASVIPSLVNGERQVGAGNLISTIKATEQGIEMQAIAVQNLAAQSVDDTDHVTSAILVPKDSPIQSAADLGGATVAVNALSSLGDLTIRATAEKAGVDPSSLKFMELPFPDMIGAAAANRVDAVWEVEPFVTAGLNAGLRAVAYNFEETAPEFPIGTYFTTREFAKKNPDTVAKFKSAVDRATEYAMANPDAVREIVLDYTKIPPAAAETMALPNLATSLDKKNVQLLGDLMLKYGLSEKLPDLDGIFGPVYGQPTG
jgi:NitT/TauT family transport system substrate-binding protein